LTAHAPSATRDEDLPLHEDVRFLAASLGQVIRRLEGEAAFETVESLRQATRSRRHGEADAPSLAALLERVDALPVDRAASTARAFTLFFLLINTAEQVHRVRRTRDYQRREGAAPQPASARHVMSSLRDAGVDKREIASAIKALQVRPVLTVSRTADSMSTGRWCTRAARRSRGHPLTRRNRRG
jgi:phosphoenolpyruvate carboxylase